MGLWIFTFSAAGHHLCWLHCPTVWQVHSPARGGAANSDWEAGCKHRLPFDQTFCCGRWCALFFCCCVWSFVCVLLFFVGPRVGVWWGGGHCNDESADATQNCFSLGAGPVHTIQRCASLQCYSKQPTCIWPFSACWVISVFPLSTELGLQDLSGHEHLLSWSFGFYMGDRVL